MTVEKSSHRERDPAWAVSALALLTIGLGVGLAWEPWAAATWLGASRVSGWVAAALLLLTLTVTPITRGLEERKRIGRWRRAFGIAAALAAGAHLGLGLAGPLRDAPASLWTWPSYRAGLLATGILFLLLLTSFAGVVRRLRVRVWKPLHRLSYVAALLVVLHLVRLPFATVVGALFFSGATLLLLGWRPLRAALARARRRPVSSGPAGDTLSEAAPRE